MKTYYITTPLYYVNASPHIGHSYTQIACDVISRFMKQNDREVFFMTGTDEHGEKIEKASLESGLPAGEEKKFVDGIVPKFKGLWDKLNIRYDHFIRTTDDYHKSTVKEIFSRLHEKGDIYKKIYKGWYCTPCEMFWSHAQAPDGLCPDCKRAIEKLDEENYFFKISAYRDRLIKCIESGGMLITPRMRKNEVLSFLKGHELQDLCISRPRERLKWGIELPFDNKFVSYVWIDALINYVSGIGYASDRKRFKELWPCDMHMIGKDILRHHAVYWPILLFALGEEPPKKVFAHGWWITGGEKMSKSKGNIVDPLYIIDEREFPVDAFRYFLLSQVEFGWDGTFSEELLIEKYNADLANNLGNLLNRTLTMVEKYFGGVLPPAGNAPESLGDEADSIRKRLRQTVDSLPKAVSGAMDIEADGPDFQRTLRHMWQAIDIANKFVEMSTPWTHAKKDDKATLAVIMDGLVQTLGVVTVLLYPFMPATSGRMAEQLGIAGDIDVNNFRCRDLAWGVIKAGTKVNKTSPLFPRLDALGKSRSR